MKDKLLILTLGFGVWICGCDTQTTPEGQENGPCRLSTEPCDGDLVCSNGRCAISTRVNQPNVNVALELSSREAIADGQSTIEIQLFITEEDGQTPFEGDVLVYTSPSGIGSLSNGLLTLDEGFGSITWDTCDRRTAILCPEVIRIQLAHRDQPMTPFFESETIRLTAELVTTPTRISIEDCAYSIGYTLAVRSPANSPEMLSTSDTNPKTNTGPFDLVMNTDSLTLSVSLPDSREQLYDTLGPDEISVTTIETTDENGEAVMMQPCLSDGVWVGSQRLNYAQHAVEDGSSETHLTALIELDCIDMNGVQHVIRGCAHGVTE